MDSSVPDRARVLAVKPPTAEDVVSAISKRAFPISPGDIVRRIPQDCEWVLLGEARLLGEASHGTKQFYQVRADITKELITERGFNAVCVEADFPDAFRANMWVRDLSNDKSVHEALSEFKRFPRWMWRNTQVANFLCWLRTHNLSLPKEDHRLRGVGFYGLDVYSLNASTQAVVRYLEQRHPEASHVAKQRYSCFDRFGADAHQYGLAIMYGYTSCEPGAIKELADMRHVVAEQREQVEGQLAEEEQDFAALANALVVKDAEQYYRNMFFGDDITWNLRDRHFMETAELGRDHLQKRGIQHPRIVIWAHNSHVGDARATDMGTERGEVTIGQLVRERYGSKDPNKVVNIGFTTHEGTVAAAENWEKPLKLEQVNPSRSDSYEFLLHSTGKKAFGLDFQHEAADLRDLLQGPRLERAIGVIYRPDTERWSHYFEAWLPQQFDMLLHIDVTSAVQPLDPPDDWVHDDYEPPDTYPFAV